MLKLLADENFNNDIVRGLFWRNSEIDLVRGIGDSRRRGCETGRDQRAHRGCKPLYVADLQVRQLALERQHEIAEQSSERRIKHRAARDVEQRGDITERI